jgi:predicted dienelactone hydrolase
MMLKTISVALVVLLVWAALTPARADYDPATTKPAAVGIVDQIWHDKARNRDVPVKIYYPSNTSGPCPVILFSHGLGASKELYGYLGNYWASRGYIAVHMTHHGSDMMAVAAGGLSHIAETGGKIAVDPKNATNRCEDVSFVIDQLTTLNADPKWELHGRADLKKIGLAGHSFGGNTTLMVAGQSFGVPGEKSYLDKRIKCAIAMSPPIVVKADDYESSLAKISIPMMIMSGTLDNSPIGPKANLDRVAAFRFLTHAPADLVVLNGGDHIVFVGSRWGGTKPGDDRSHQLIQLATTAFFDGYLKEDAAAKKWLEDGGFAGTAGKDAEFTHQ